MATYTQSGISGAALGDDSTITVTHNPLQVESNIRVLVDWDDDGDFSEPEEDITKYVLNCQVTYGRDTASQVAGQASPGSLKATLSNHALPGDTGDGRFSYFNADSPLKQPPYNLESGKLIRVQTDDATSFDPTLLAADNFATDGGLITDDLGNLWIGAAPLIKSGGTATLPTSADAAPHIDLGLDYAFMQYESTLNDRQCWNGFVYGYDDGADTFGLLRWVHSIYDQTWEHCLASITGGVITITSTLASGVWGEYADGHFYQMLLSSTDDKIYIYRNGVLLGSTPMSGSVTGQGMGFAIGGYANRQRAIGSFKIWDDEPSAGSGVIWTGRTTSLHPSVTNHQSKTVELQATGPLSLAASADISSLALLGEQTGISGGLLAGEYAGNALLKANIAPLTTLISQVKLGGKPSETTKALDAARAAETVELGRLFETPEGYIGFAQRSSIGSGVLCSSWSDVPGVAEFAPEAVAINDWRNEKRNRVISRVTPKLPRLIVWADLVSGGAAGSQVKSGDAFTSVVSQAQAGDLLLNVFWGSNTTANEDWIEPTGWKEVRGSTQHEIGRFKVYAKILQPEDLAIGANTTFYNNTSLVGGLQWGMTHLIRDFYGSIAEGIHVVSSGFSAFPMVAAAQNGVVTLDPIVPPWGGGTTLHFRFHGTQNASTTSAGRVDTLTESKCPAQFYSAYTYNGSGSGATRAMDIAVAGAVASSSAARIEDSKFQHNQRGFDWLESINIAVRGDTRTTRDTNYLEVVSNDLDSQKKTGGALSFELNGLYFQSETEAATFNNIILQKYSKDSPTINMEFSAVKNAAYYLQARDRRLGDRIHLDLTGNTDLGLQGEYTIETISHGWSHGGTYWRTVWGLAPS